jgi:pimeloyl-ACP methyl ester carboxylesterase
MLLVSGAESPAHIKAVTDRLAKLVPDADRLIIAGATHNMFTSHPAEFNAGVLRFLRSQSLEPETALGWRLSSVPA